MSCAADWVPVLCHYRCFFFLLQLTFFGGKITTRQAGRVPESAGRREMNLNEFALLSKSEVRSVQLSGRWEEQDHDVTHSSKTCQSCCLSVCCSVVDRKYLTEWTSRTFNYVICCGLELCACFVLYHINQSEFTVECSHLWTLHQSYRKPWSWD